MGRRRTKVLHRVHKLKIKRGAPEKGHIRLVGYVHSIQFLPEYIESTPDSSLIRPRKIENERSEERYCGTRNWQSRDNDDPFLGYTWNSSIRGQHLLMKNLLGVPLTHFAVMCPRRLQGFTSFAPSLPFLIR